MNEKEVAIVFSSQLWCIFEWNSFSNKNKCRAGLDFVKLIGLLWFAISVTSREW